MRLYGSAINRSAHGFLLRHPSDLRSSGSPRSRSGATAGACSAFPLRHQSLGTRWGATLSQRST
ncbi:Hypothetical protein A7982_11682 [Minicystis rosea]|nr:Hypothetical protein A7982_11682 [Minicystis rosea]